VIDRVKIIAQHVEGGMAWRVISGQRGRKVPPTLLL
jgi:hypothetical protein